MTRSLVGLGLGLIQKRGSDDDDDDEANEYAHKAPGQA